MGNAAPGQEQPTNVYPHEPTTSCYCDACVAARGGEDPWAQGPGTEAPEGAHQQPHVQTKPDSVNTPGQGGRPPSQDTGEPYTP